MVIEYQSIDAVPTGSGFVANASFNVYCYNQREADETRQLLEFMKQNYSLKINISDVSAPGPDDVGMQRVWAIGVWPKDDSKAMS